MREKNISEFESQLAKTLNIKVQAVFEQSPNPRIQLTFPFSYQGKKSTLVFHLKAVDALPILLDDEAYNNFTDYIKSQLASATSISEVNIQNDLDDDSLPW